MEASSTPLGVRRFFTPKGETGIQRHSSRSGRKRSRQRTLSHQVADFPPHKALCFFPPSETVVVRSSGDEAKLFPPPPSSARPPTSPPPPPPPCCPGNEEGSGGEIKFSLREFETGTGRADSPEGGRGRHLNTGAGKRIAHRPE